MRLQYAVADFGKGFKRNLTMTLAVILTTWVSLSLFGAALLVRDQVNLMKGVWYDKIQISVYMCTPVSVGAGCQGREVTETERSAIRQAIVASPDTAPGGVFYQSKDEAFAEFREQYKDSPLLDVMAKDQLPQSFRVKLKDPQRYAALMSAVQGLPGVDNVTDLRKYLDPLFRTLNMMRWAAIGAAVLLLVTGGLLIANTIRLAAYARRRELGIMRLLGASRFYIQLPFLLEAVVAALIGAVMACTTLYLTVYYVITKRTQGSLNPSWRWIDNGHVFGVSLILFGVGIVLALVPTFITTRRYLRG